MVVSPTFGPGEPDGIRRELYPQWGFAEHGPGLHGAGGRRRGAMTAQIDRRCGPVYGWAPVCFAVGGGGETAVRGAARCSRYWNCRSVSQADAPRFKRLVGRTARGAIYIDQPSLGQVSGGAIPSGATS